MAEPVNKSPSDMSNGELLAKISAHQEAIKALKKFIKPATAAPTATLAESNASMLERRNAKFKQAAEEKEAITAALVIAKQTKRK